MENQKILESVADISYLAGEQKFFSGNSRSDVSEFILWARIFHEIHKETDWNQIDYIETIQDFANVNLSRSAV